ncbi:MAG: deoxyribose-phosphate aldolase [Candidatus Solibacter usitatus]|nr:deoxyribose-phosphate aldolase [Candidatus Solibacter usitatus]
MDPAPEARPALTTLQALAALFDHALLRPDLTDDDIATGCRMAVGHGIAAVTVRPTDIELAARLLDGSSVVTASTAGFPHGASTTAVKIYEARDLVRRGAREIGLVLNTGKLLSRQFQHVEMEVLQAARACHESGARFKAILESCYLAADIKVIALKICKRCEADFVVTATGFGPSGWQPGDLPLMARVLRDVCLIEAAGAIETLDDALSAYSLGASRIGSSHTAAILDEWKARLAADSAAADSGGRFLK